MYEFTYHIKFRIVHDLLDVSIFLSLEDLFTPVYVRQFHVKDLEDSKKVEQIHNEMYEYLDKKSIMMSHDDMGLFYHVMKEYKLALPQVKEVKAKIYDESLDDYSHLITPKEIVFLQYADGKAIDDKRFDSWKEENTLETELLKERMLEKGYLKTNDCYYNLTKAKRELLLEVIEHYNIDARGDNKDLIERIKDTLPKEEIEKIFSGSHYTLSKKGIKIIDRSKKLLEFNRSFFRTINKLSLEEFHLLNIKKIDYDFNGVGRLLMLNIDNDVIDDAIWKQFENEETKVNKDFDIQIDDKKNAEKETVKEAKAEENIHNEETKDEYDEILKDLEKVQTIKNDGQNDDFLDIINKINVNYNNEDEETEDHVEVEDDFGIEEIDEEVYIEENEKVKKQLDAYKAKREDYEKGISKKQEKKNNKDSQKEEKKNKKQKYKENKKEKQRVKVTNKVNKKNKEINLNFEEEVYKEENKKPHPILQFILVIILLSLSTISLLYINERLELLKMPFTLKEVYKAIEKTFKGYWKIVLDFIDYVKAYRSK